MFKKLKGAVKSIGRQVEKNVKTAGKMVESNVRGAKKLAKGDIKGAVKSVRNTGKLGAGAFKDTMSNNRSTAKGLASGGMTMGMLDKMRAETGQTAAIPREAMAEGVASAAEKYNKA